MKRRAGSREPLRGASGVGENGVHFPGSSGDAAAGGVIAEVSTAPADVSPNEKPGSSEKREIAKDTEAMPSPDVFPIKAVESPSGGNARASKKRMSNATRPPAAKPKPERLAAVGGVAECSAAPAEASEGKIRR